MTVVWCLFVAGLIYLIVKVIQRRRRLKAFLAKRKLETAFLLLFLLQILGVAAYTHAGNYRHLFSLYLFWIIIFAYVIFRISCKTKWIYLGLIFIVAANIFMAWKGLVDGYKYNYDRKGTYYQYQTEYLDFDKMTRGLAASLPAGNYLIQGVTSYVRPWLDLNMIRYLTGYYSEGRVNLSLTQGEAGVIYVGAAEDVTAKLEVLGQTADWQDFASYPPNSLAVVFTDQ
jgi:MFS family permease